MPWERGQGLGCGGDAMDGSGSFRVRPGLWREEEYDTRAPCVSEKREGEAYRFGAGADWATGCFLAWVGLIPRDLSSFFDLLFFFLF
jgi:hypothetical protein